jgi:hypothetical protein
MWQNNAIRRHLKNTRNWSSERSYLSIPKRRLTRHLVSLFLRFFTNNSGWTLPALFATLRDLRDLAFDVRSLPLVKPRVDVRAGGCASTRFVSKK